MHAAQRPALSDLCKNTPRASVKPQPPPGRQATAAALGRGARRTSPRSSAADLSLPPDSGSSDGSVQRGGHSAAGSASPPRSSGRPSTWPTVRTEPPAAALAAPAGAVQPPQLAPAPSTPCESASDDEGVPEPDHSVMPTPDLAAAGSEASTARPEPPAASLPVPPPRPPTPPPGGAAVSPGAGGAAQLGSARGSGGLSRSLSSAAAPAAAQAAAEASPGSNPPRRSTPALPSPRSPSPPAVPPPLQPVDGSDEEELKAALAQCAGFALSLPRTPSVFAGATPPRLPGPSLPSQASPEPAAAPSALTPARLQGPPLPPQHSPPSVGPAGDDPIILDIAATPLPPSAAASEPELFPADADSTPPTAEPAAAGTPPSAERQQQEAESEPTPTQRPPPGFAGYLPAGPFFGSCTMRHPSLPPPGSPNSDDEPAPALGQRPSTGSGAWAGLVSAALAPPSPQPSPERFALAPSDLPVPGEEAPHFPVGSGVLVLRTSGAWERAKVASYSETDGYVIRLKAGSGTKTIENHERHEFLRPLPPPQGRKARGSVAAAPAMPPPAKAPAPQRLAAATLKAGAKVQVLRSSGAWEVGKVESYAPKEGCVVRLMRGQGFKNLEPHEVGDFVRPLPPPQKASGGDRKRAAGRQQSERGAKRRRGSAQCAAEEPMDTTTGIGWSVDAWRAPLPPPPPSPSGRQLETPGGDQDDDAVSSVGSPRDAGGDRRRRFARRQRPATTSAGGPDAKRQRSATRPDAPASPVAAQAGAEGEPSPVRAEAISALREREQQERRAAQGLREAAAAAANARRRPATPEHWGRSKWEMRQQAQAAAAPIAQQDPSKLKGEARMRCIAAQQAQDGYVWRMRMFSGAAAGAAQGGAEEAVVIDDEFLGQLPRFVCSPESASGSDNLACPNSAPVHPPGLLGLPPMVTPEGNGWSPDSADAGPAGGAQRAAPQTARPRPQRPPPLTAQKLPLRPAPR
eukprot:TRINITY_DN4916_c0_g2_i2.p1 TRINITY_DN4916_c0_g2~~TRINITY_DN4916_c0_g2_i2.p1  ORF type:complete len:1008 (+),score=200.42 TRINITY_DN4916_c0_g2_i2:114-3026(+)